MARIIADSMIPMTNDSLISSLLLSDHSVDNVFYKSNRFHQPHIDRIASEMELLCRCTDKVAYLSPSFLPHHFLLSSEADASNIKVDCTS